MANVHRIKLLASIMIIVVSSIMGCSSSSSTDNSAVDWQLKVIKAEVKDKLESIETVKQYIGSTEEVHQIYPAEGNVFLIMKVNISMNKPTADPFKWSQLIVRDEVGNTYNRSANDTFLEQYGYSPRMTGLEIKFGDNEGWICYEIPAGSASGKLILAYTAQGSLQEIQIRK